MGNSRELGALAKLYSDEWKYGGSHDIFDYCLQVFRDQCPKAGITPAAYATAFSIMLKGQAARYYFRELTGKGLSFDQMTSAIRTKFETEEHRQRLLQRWETITLAKIQSENTDKSIVECFESMQEELASLQSGLLADMQSETVLRDKLYLACRTSPACAFGRFKRADTFDRACEDMRTALSIEMEQGTLQRSYPADQEDTAFYTDRRFGFSRGRGNFRGRGFRGRRQPNYPRGNRSHFHIPGKKCIVYNQEGCYNTNHSREERERAFNNLKNTTRWDDSKARNYVIELEGIAPDSSEEYEQFVDEIEIRDEEEPANIDNLVMEVSVLTAYGDINGAEVNDQLERQAILHAFSRNSFLRPSYASTPAHLTCLTTRYSTSRFMGILIDTGATGSTAGHNQYVALQQIQITPLNVAKASEVNITFGIGKTSSIGTIDVNTPIGTVTFHVVDADVPFLLCLQDLDRLGAKYDNLANVIIQGNMRTPVIRAYGHPWLLLNHAESMAYSHNTIAKPYSEPIECHLTEAELRQLHRRFGHPSAGRLHRVLERAGHDEDYNLILRITKYCEQCQKHGKPPGRFKFTLKDDRDFNHTVIMDILHIDGKPVLQIVDESTAYQSARFLKDFSAEETWNAFRACWMDVYLGPPAYAVHDPGTSFNAEGFRNHAKTFGIQVKQMPVEAHHSIGRVERYHVPLRRAYMILLKEIPDISKEYRLQMAVKAVNDTAGPDGIVPTLLVYGAYPRMSADDPPSASITQRAVAIRHAMADVRKCHAARKVQEALRTRNGPRTSHLADLPLGSEVLVYREKKGWTGPYPMVAIDGETCALQLPSGITFFRSTSVRPFNKEPIAIDHSKESPTNDEETANDKTMNERASPKAAEPEAAVTPDSNAETTQIQSERIRPRVEIPAYIPDPNKQIF